METDVIIGIVFTVIGTTIGFFLRLFIDRYTSRKKKLDDIHIDKKVENLSNKLQYFYWPIYFRILMSYNAIKQLCIYEGEFELENFYSYEQNTILKIHNEILDIINNNIHLIQMNQYMSKILLLYIKHVTVYKHLRDIKCYDMPGKYDAPYPEEFTTLIIENTMSTQKEYNYFIGESFNENEFISKYDDLKDILKGKRNIKDVDITINERNMIETIRKNTKNKKDRVTLVTDFFVNKKYKPDLDILESDSNISRSKTKFHLKDVIKKSRNSENNVSDLNISNVETNNSFVSTSDERYDNTKIIFDKLNQKKITLLNEMRSILLDINDHEKS